MGYNQQQSPMVLGTTIVRNNLTTNGWLILDGGLIVNNHWTSIFISIINHHHHYLIGNELLILLFTAIANMAFSGHKIHELFWRCWNTSGLGKTREISWCWTGNQMEHQVVRREAQLRHRIVSGRAPATNQWRSLRRPRSGGTFLRAWQRQHDWLLNVTTFGQKMAKKCCYLRFLDVTVTDYIRC